MAGIRRYRVRYTDHDEGDETVHVSRIEEFRSLRHAGEFIVKLIEDPLRDFLTIEAVAIEKLTDQEKAALVFFTDGKLEMP